MHRTSTSILIASTTMLVFSAAITNNRKDKQLQNLNSDRDVQNDEIITRGTDERKDRAASESKNIRSFSSSPFHRTSFIARHGGYGIGLGTSVRVGPPHGGGAGYGPPDGPNFDSSGYGHTGAGVHVSGNGYSYGAPGERPPSPPFDHRGAGPLPDAYDGATYGSAYPHVPAHNGGGLIYAGQTGGHFGPSSQPGGPPGPLAGHHLGPHHKLALKSVLIPLAGVAILGAAAALSSAHPILLQLGVAGKRRRRGLVRHGPKRFVERH